MKRILCLSGGGVKGIAQLPVLEMLEDIYGPLHKYYDLVVGTSVGAINAGFVSSGTISMNVLRQKYKEFALQIFNKRFGFRIPKYNREHFKSIFDNYTNSIKFGDLKTDTIMVATDLVSDTNVFFKSWKTETKEELASTIIQRSFSAPLYFGKIVDQQNKMVYSDGGIGNANLPIQEAKLHAETHGWYSDGEECEIHIVGALFTKNTNTFDKISTGSVIHELQSMFTLKNGGFARKQSREDQLRMLTYACENIPSLSFKYWDSDIPKKMNKLDGIEYIDDYLVIGELMAKEPLLMKKQEI